MSPVHPEVAAYLRQRKGVYTHYREAAALIVVSPILAELVSGSVPPLSFFVPWVFALFALLYGSSSLLIRELTLRWGSGWSGILLMGGAFGILQEGCATRAFFDPLWHSMGPLTGHGRWFGVNWIWSIDAILYHAVYSTALPIVLVYQIFPGARKQRWIGTRGLWVATCIFIATLAVFVHAGSHYPVPAWYFAVCAAIVFLLCLAAYGIRQETKVQPIADTAAVWFGVLGFAATAGLLLQIYVAPRFGGTAATVALLVALVVTCYGLFKRWTGGGAHWSANQQFGFLSGALGCFALLDLVQEHNPTRSDNTSGMSLVGIAVLAGVTWLGLRLRRNGLLENR